MSGGRAGEGGRGVGAVYGGLGRREEERGVSGSARKEGCESGVGLGG